MALAPWGAEVIEVLHKAGFSAYAVGGCIRDLLLGREPKDWDVATSARPEQVMALFPKTFATGLKHGTVTALVMGKPVEVTTFRREGGYSDRRRPDQVLFSDDPRVDAARRDFTVNALYWDGKGEILDFFSGREDLKNRVIRTVGEGKSRFSEDALRILRAARFCAELGFSVAPSVQAAMRETAVLLKQISRERIGEEWEKILLSDPVRGFSLLEETGCRQVVDSRIAAGEREWKACACLPEVKAARWAALLWNSFLARDILNGFRRDGKTVSRAVWLTEHKRDELGSDYAVKRLAADGSVSGVQQLLLVREAFGETGGMERFERICRENGFVNLHSLALTGAMLLEAGICTGKEIGEVRNWLLEQVLLGQVCNDSEKLTKKLMEKR